MVHEDAAGNPRIQPRDVAGVVHVVVRGHDVIERLDPQGLGRRDDPIGVPVVLGWITGVDQHRLAARWHDDHGFAALGVEHVQVEGVGRLEGSENQQQEEGKGRQVSHGLLRDCRNPAQRSIRDNIFSRTSRSISYPIPGLVGALT